MMVVICNELSQHFGDDSPTGWWLDRDDWWVKSVHFIDWTLGVGWHDGYFNLV